MGHSQATRLMLCAVLTTTAVAAPPMAVDPETGEAAQVREAPPSRVPDTPRSPRPTPRSIARADAFRADVNVHAMDAVSNEERDAADASFAAEFGHVRPGPMRAGMVRPMPEVLVMDDTTSQAFAEEDGQTLRTMAVRSPGANAVRIHFTQFDVGDGSVLLYAYAGDECVVRGPYSGRGPLKTGDFWSGSLPGDTVYVEVVGTEDPIVEVSEVVHFDRGFAQPTGGDPPEGGPLPCHLDPLCYVASTVDPIARDAVGILTDISMGGNVPFCSGTLLNDLDPDGIAPLFLTAYHCMSTQAEANTLEVFWLFQTDECDGNVPLLTTLTSNLGATLLETNPTSGGNDMCFLRLNTELPGGLGLAGWTTAHPNDAYGIHHPAGSWKRVHFMDAEGACPGCEFCGDGTDYDYYQFLPGMGVSEPGSSGSGIFNTSGQLFGQLFGTCCVISDCADGVFDCVEAPEFDAQYGEFETTYPMVQTWLEIGGTIRVDHANTTPPWQGTPANPFPTVGLGHSFAWDGSQISIKAGSYNETLTLNKEVRLLADGGTVAIGQ